MYCNRQNTKAAPVVGRFAPTPSGRMHLGNVFALLMAWLGARSQGGTIVLRIEDLDPRGADRACAEQLIDDLAWLGLTWDEGPFWQSERTVLYEEALEKLYAQELIYPCFCTRQELHAATAPHASDGTYVYAGTCRNLTPEEVSQRRQVRPPALRLKVPDEQICFADKVYGLHAEHLATECGDFLVQRSDGVFAYQLAVAVDDAAMGVTQVVRGCDLLCSTARQIYIQHTLGLTTPEYAHIPLLVAPDGRRLSKRDRDLDIGALKAQGATPEQIIGGLAGLLGLVHAGETCMSQDLIGIFSWDVIAEHRANITCESGFLAQAAVSSLSTQTES